MNNSKWFLDRRFSLPRLIAVAGGLILSANLSGCAQIRNNRSAAKPAPAPVPVITTATSSSGVFGAGGLAMLMPTAPSDKDEERQGLAQTFCAALGKHRPDLVVTPLAATLSSIGSAGLTDVYNGMYLKYKNTGTFDAESLRKIAAAAGVRYLLQLNLASSDQSDSSLFSMMGISVLHKESASAKLFVQIWDTTTGKIVWEHSDEASKTHRSVRDRPVSVDSMLEDAANSLAQQLPR